MRVAGRLVARVLAAMREYAKAGRTTMQLERRAVSMIRAAGARPAFKGFYVQPVHRKFPTALCTSVNEEVVHGIPSRRRVLHEGDIVKVDCGVELDGYFGDSATTIEIGEVSLQKRRLLTATREALSRAIQQAVSGNRVYDIGRAVHGCVQEYGFSIVRSFAGHGIGRHLHEYPVVPNWEDPDAKNVRLRPGLVVAIEPMVVAGNPEVETLKDQFTAVTTDGSPAAHFEHCVAVTRKGPRVLTLA